MSVQASIPQRADGRRYEAVLRLSEALSLCQEPEDLTKILSEQLRQFLDFLQFYIVIYKENSTEVEHSRNEKRDQARHHPYDLTARARPMQAKTERRNICQRFKLITSVRITT